jgi:hypothetical protein
MFDRSVQQSFSPIRTLLRITLLLYRHKGLRLSHLNTIKLLQLREHVHCFGLCQLAVRILFDF